MIDYIKGTLISKTFSEIIVESGGIGYNVKITLPAYDSLPSVGKEINILTSLYIRDNPYSMVLYGFCDERERDCFKLIISVSGIGPKTAVNMLSAIGHAELTELVAKGDYQPLTSISGVGKKTAERVVVELKDKILKPGQDLIMRTVSANGEPSRVSEIIGALLSLGYNRSEAEKMVRKVTLDSKWKDLGVEQIIKDILRGD